MNSVKAFAPGNVSCIFVIKSTKNPATSGSLGLGFTVDRGVVAEVKKINARKKLIKKKISNKKNMVYFNGKKTNLPTVDSVIKKLSKEKLEVRIRSDFPLSCGFGVSGASALATAYALNKMLNLKKPKKELAKIAHVAEVENGTGLGDVVNQYHGGFLVKFESSYKFKVKRISIKNKTMYYRIFSKLDTKKVISNKRVKDRVNKAGLKSMKKIRALKDKNLKDLIKISKEFSIGSGLLKNKKIIGTIKKIEEDNGSGSMIMLGNAVFSDIKFKGSRKLMITGKGAYVL